MEFWTTEQRGAVAIATFSNPPRNYLVAPAVDELKQLIEEWRDPSIRAVVIQSRPEDAGSMTRYSVEKIYRLISDPMTARYSAAIVRRYKAIFDRLQALPNRMLEESLAFVVEDVRSQATFAPPGLCRLMMHAEQ